MKNLIPALAVLAIASIAPAQSLFGGNIIKNGSFEAGATSVDGASVAVPDWNGTTTVGEYGATNWWEVPAGPWSDGIKFAGGGNFASNSINQTFTIDAADFATVDAGQAAFTVDGWFGGWSSNNDNAILNVTFKNSVGGDFRTIQIGGVTATDRNNVTSMLFRSATGVLDSGTRSIVFNLVFTRTNGTYSDGSAENLRFNANAVPEPVSMVALFLGAGLLARRKRSA
ncbi:MAG: PEP-CTERM sorting domain-containing protein [Armatimonadetes bacterium]|nr:PEP-CTERM sorting domain-containing protein [Armatimonadota bacterium]